LGIGINLTATAFPPELAATAISLEEATAQRVERETVLAALVSALRHYYELFQQGSYEQILEEWRQRSSYASGKLVRVATGGEIIQGVTQGLEADGALRVETANGAIKIIHAGDVTALRPYE